MKLIVRSLCFILTGIHLLVFSGGEELHRFAHLISGTEYNVSHGQLLPDCKQNVESLKTQSSCNFWQVFNLTSSRPFFSIPDFHFALAGMTEAAGPTQHTVPFQKAEVSANYSRGPPDLSLS